MTFNFNGLLTHATRSGSILNTMPLKKSKTKRAREENIHELIRSGKPHKQAVAIAYSVQREAKKRSSKRK